MSGCLHCLGPAAESAFPCPGWTLVYVAVQIDPGVEDGDDEWG